MSRSRLVLHLLLGWPLPRFAFPAIGVAVALGTLAGTRGLLLSPYVTWPDVSAAWHESLPLPASLASGLSAVIASALFARASPLALPVRPRLGATAAAVHFAGAAAWAMAGHVVGMLPATAYGAATATWGNLRVVDAVVGLLGLGEFVALGFLGGLVFRSAIAAPFIALTTGILTLLPNSPVLRPLALLQPVQQWTASARFVPNPFVVSFSLVFTVATLLAAMAAIDGILRGRMRVGTPHAALAAGPVALAVMAFLWRPELYVDGGKPPRVCTEARGARVCMHQAYAKSLPLVTRTVRALQEAGASPLLNGVTDVNLGLPASPTTGTVVLSLALAPPDPGLVTQSIREQVAEQVSSVTQPAGCLRRGGGITAFDLGGVIRNRILIDAGFVTLADRLNLGGSPDVTAARAAVDAMSSTTFAAFVAERSVAIGQCTLSTGDFAGS